MPLTATTLDVVDATIARRIGAHHRSLRAPVCSAEKSGLHVAEEALEAQEALDRLKASLTHAPILTPPMDGEPLYLYVAATTQVVSAVIIVERQEEGHALPVQRPVYYISKVLSETKTCYP